MGFTYEISIWVEVACCEYAYKSLYQGESLWKAIKTMRQQKKLGYRCIKFEWRPPYNLD
jgi:hypothetical protein